MQPRFSDDGAIVYLDHDEVMTLDELTSALLKLREDPRCSPGVALVADRSRLPPPSTEFVRGVVDFLVENRETFAGCRMAQVVPDVASFGMARMYQTLLDRHDMSVEIFHDLAAAESWARQETSPHTI